MVQIKSNPFSSARPFRKIVDSDWLNVAVAQIFVELSIPIAPILSTLTEYNKTIKSQKMTLTPFKVKSASIPPFPHCKTPYLIGIGTPQLKWDPNQPKRVSHLPVLLTLDHRILDGYEGATMARTLKKLLQNPSKWLDT